MDWRVIFISIFLVACHPQSGDSAKSELKETKCLNFKEKQQRYPQASQYDLNYGKYAYALNCKDYAFEDPSVWVYTAAFAQRFGMPKRWIHKDLEGAEAISFRPIQLPVENCAAAKIKGCKNELRFIYTIYLKASAPIAWLSNSTQSAPLHWWGILQRLGLAENYLAQQNYTAIQCRQGDSRLACQHAALDKRLLKDLNLHSLMFAEGVVPQAFSIDYLAANTPTNTSPEKRHQVTLPADFVQRTRAHHQKWLERAKSFLPYRPTVWLYSADFAKRFNLATEGVSTELQGAEALISSAVPNSKLLCSPDKCNMRSSENFELNILFPSSVNIAWGSEHIEHAEFFWYDELSVLEDSHDPDAISRIFGGKKPPIAYTELYEEAKLRNYWNWPLFSGGVAAQKQMLPGYTLHSFLMSPYYYFYRTEFQDINYFLSSKVRYRVVIPPQFRVRLKAYKENLVDLTVPRRKSLLEKTIDRIKSARGLDRGD